MNVLESTNANGLNPDNFFRILRAFHQWALNSTLHRGPFGSRRTWIHLLTEMKWSCTTNIHIAVWQNSHKSDTNRPANSMRLTRLSELGNEFSIGLQWLGPENPFKLCDKPTYSIWTLCVLLSWRRRISTRQFANWIWLINAEKKYANFMSRSFALTGAKIYIQAWNIRKI